MEKKYEMNEVFVTSFYLTTAVVGKNDNRLQLTKSQLDVSI